jgi:hypothetical protein
MYHTLLYSFNYTLRVSFLHTNCQPMDHSTKNLDIPGKHPESSPHKSFQPMDYSTENLSTHLQNSSGIIPSVSTHTATRIITHCLIHSTTLYVFHFFVKISNPWIILQKILDTHDYLLWNHHLVKPTKPHHILQL